MRKVIFHMYKEHLKNFSKKMRVLEKQGDSATWDLHEPSMSLKKIADVFGNVIALQMIYRLLSPGLFTCQRIQKELGVDIKAVETVLSLLKELEIVEQQTLGIYVCGMNGHFAISLFAWIVLNKEE